jgi:hypothetical protein
VPLERDTVRCLVLLSAEVPPCRWRDGSDGIGDSARRPNES